MKRICIITLFILLASCAPAQSGNSANQPGELSLSMPSACQSMEDGLCVVSPAGETLGGGKTTIINQEPTAEFLDQTSAIQIKIAEWTLVFDPGQGIPFSVGMTFPGAKLYPQGKGVGMDIENNGNKCDQLDGVFSDLILQSAQNGAQQINPISSFDILFAMRCNGESQVLQGRVKMSQK
jgi:hypothetical protein